MQKDYQKKGQNYPIKSKGNNSLKKIFAMHITNAILVLILLLEIQHVYKEGCEEC